MHMSESQTPEMIADKASEQLHRALATAPSEGRCFLFLDPTLNPPDEDPVLGAWLAEHPAVKLPISHPEFDPSLRPLLIELDSNKAKESDVLRYSVTIAVNELDPDALKYGGGRSVGGWLVSTAPAKQLAVQLAAQLLQSPALGHQSLVRLQDPAVLWAWNSQMTEPQRNKLLGQLQQWWFLDPLGHLQHIEQTAPIEDKITPLQFSATEWEDLDTLGAINRAMHKWVAKYPAAQHCDQAGDIAWAALRRARSYGFKHANDLTFFVECALLIHPDFDRNERVQKYLKQRTPNDYFKALMDPLTEEDWLAISNSAKPAGLSIKTQD